nr:MAG TPA: hypothetical protein [Caudoviricetes sp.]
MRGLPYFFFTVTYSHFPLKSYRTVKSVTTLW